MHLLQHLHLNLDQPRHFSPPSNMVRKRHRMLWVTIPVTAQLPPTPTDFFSQLLWIGQGHSWPLMFIPTLETNAGICPISWDWPKICWFQWLQWNYHLGNQRTSLMNETILMMVLLQTPFYQCWWAPSPLSDQAWGFTLSSSHVNMAKLHLNKELGIGSLFLAPHSGYNIDIYSQCFKKSRTVISISELTWT